ncbi:MAG: ATP-dependent Clp protease ATP-binding subunit [Armatimonadetes bacterium]|nr:ATP-dependent Clp protease ATP-binding subunit [Armatimonadota bacterium]
MRRDIDVLEQIRSAAVHDAQRLRHNWLGVEHLFLALLRIENGVTVAALQHMGHDPSQVRQRLREHVGVGNQAVENPPLTPRAERVLQTARLLAQQQNVTPSEVHLLVAILQDGPNAAVRVLNEMGINPDALAQAAVNIRHRRRVGGEAAADTRPILERGRDLTELARQGQLHEVIGRQQELAMLAQTLCRKDKNNPVLVGEAGVGKTAIVEGLAYRIARGDVHPELRNKRIVELSTAVLVAGTTLRGEFEQRMMQLIEELRSQPDVIVFFDEIHTLLGAGAGQGSALDAANILKPALARGEIRCIGATTIAEYRRYIEADPALERRFQPIMVEEPSPETTLEILRGLKERYERHHGVTITDEALEAAVKLTRRYVPERRFPDKALDAIDQACARTRLPRLTHRQDQRPTDAQASGLLVTPQVVAEVVAQWTGRPATELTQDDAQRLLRMEEELNQVVIGQQRAVSQVASALRIAAARLRGGNRPMGVFLFVGPTGVGKTELAKEIARFLFGSRDAMIRLDMSEYMERHNVARLIGAPPGYVGHEEEGQLTGPLRTRPHSVVLLDEIEKAHPDVLNVLLQVFDDGRLTDGKGRTCDCRDAIFIMTSNLGNEEPDLFARTVPDERERQERLMRLLLRHLRPEFLNRIDEVVIFHPLGTEDIRRIAELMVSEIQRLVMEEHGIALHITESAWQVLVSVGYDHQFGARPMRRAVERLLVRPLSELLLAGGWQRGDIVIVSGVGDRLSLERLNQPNLT